MSKLVANAALIHPTQSIFAYNAKCYAFLHTQKQKDASKHLREDRREVCVNTGRLTGGLLCTEGKNRGRADKVHQGQFNRWTWLLQLQI